MRYAPLEGAEISRSLFSRFSRRQVVTRCWRKREGVWRVEDIAFVDDWGEAEWEVLVSCLKETLASGGAVFGAFEADALKGFSSVEARPLGARGQYLDLSSIHVSEDARGRGAGRALFSLVKDWARARGAEKLYISAHSSVESQAFYRAMGCVEALEYDASHVAKEPCDCQLECAL